MKSQNTKSSDELQREVRQEVRNVNRDLDNIQGRLSPGKIIDDAIFSSHGRSPAAIFDHLKRNPIGTTFLSLGTLLLMEDESHTTYESSARNKISSARSTVNDKMSLAKEKIQSHMPVRDPNAPSITEKAKAKLSGVKDSFDSKVSEIREGLEARVHRKEITETFLSADESNSEGYAGLDIEGSKGSKLKNVKEKLSSGLSQGREKLSAGLSQGKEKFQNMDNTTFMALGAGLGILTGASLPISDAEERMVNDKLQGRLSDFNSELREAMNECSNILKDLVINDVKEIPVKFF